MRPPERAELLLRKAAHDEVLLDQVLSSPQVSDEVIGFHLQQAAEKLLKALLAAREVRYGRIHNLRALMDLLTDAGCPLPERLQDLDALTPFGTLLRYEDVPSGAPIDRPRARALVRELRRFVEEKLRR